MLKKGAKNIIFLKFVKKYLDVHKLINLAIKKYSKDVKENKFPSTKNTF